MLSYLDAGAFSCELASAICLVINEMRQRKNTSRLETISDHTTAIESNIRDFENLEPAPGFEVIPGMQFDEVRKIMIEATRDAVGINKKKFLETKKEIEDASRFPLGVVALALLIAGILMHIIERL